MRTILSRALAELNAHQSVVLVTIVAEQGSAPRGPGSQMLVGADGQLTGTIGGGQVERQSELLALSLLKERRSQMQHFALTQAGADSLGMACGGDVTVLFQFISPEDALWQSVLETALAQLTAAQPGWLILRTDGSAPALLDGEGMALLGSSGTAPLSKRCVLTETDFSLPLPIGERAVIFGAGQPKFRSKMSGRACSTILAASTIVAVSRPYICMATGRSSSLMFSFCSVLLTERISASADTNSVYTMSAPKRLHISRKAGSVTSSIGARSTGRSPKSMLAIFIFCCVLGAKVRKKECFAAKKSYLCV